MGRPAPRFKDFIGHKKTVDQLRRTLDGAKQLEEPFPHSLFIGPSGVGKTQLAKALAAEYGTSCHETFGGVSQVTLAGTFLNLQFGDFVFVDEAHGLVDAAQELMYRVMDDWSVPPLEKGKSNDGNAVESKAVQPCSIILATDQPGRLRRALRRRVAYEVLLSFYPVKELKEIVEKMCADKDIEITAQAARMIAAISRGVPGTALNHVGMLRLRHPDVEQVQLGKGEVDDYCEAMGIDSTGLTPRDRQYIGFLRDVNPASKESLALSLGVDVAEICRFIEPFLVREKLVRISSGGRRLTDKGRSIATSFIVDSEANV